MCLHCEATLCVLAGVCDVRLQSFSVNDTLRVGFIEAEGNRLVSFNDPDSTPDEALLSTTYVTVVIAPDCTLVMSSVARFPSNDTDDLDVVNTHDLTAFLQLGVDQAVAAGGGECSGGIYSSFTVFYRIFISKIR